VPQLGGDSFNSANFRDCTLVKSLVQSTEHLFGTQFSSHHNHALKPGNNPREAPHVREQKKEKKKKRKKEKKRKTILP